MTSGLAEVLAWIGSSDAQAIDAKLVPGASEHERRHLGALGGLVRELLGSDMPELPSEIEEWFADGPAVPPGVVDAAREALRDDPDPVLADLYGQLVTSSNRRALGTFFTPAQEVELMLNMWAAHEEAPNSVVDVGAGVGVFTASAARRWPSAAVYAADINPVTLGLLALRVAEQLPPRRAAQDQAGVRLVRDDFTRWIAHAGAELPSPRLILGNPPYTRAQLMATEDRERLGRAAGGLCGSRASLSALITAISLLHLRPDDGLCLLLPAQWLESSYAAPLRKHIAGLSRRRVELRLVDSWRFPDAQVDAVALLVGRERARKQPMCVATWEAKTAKALVRADVAATQWRSLFIDPPTTRSRITDDRPVDGTVNIPNSGEPVARLSDFCAVRRGVATGANEFFVLSDKEVAKHALPPGRLLPLVRRLLVFPDVVDGIAFDNLDQREKRWLLNADRRHRYQGSALDRYLTLGEISGFDQRLLCDVRKGEWYDLRHDIVVPDVIVGPMTRGSVRIVENRLGCVITNNLYGWVWRDGVSESDRQALLAWLRGGDGQAAVLAASRRQGDGLNKIEPKALARVVVPSAVARPPHTLL